MQTNSLAICIIGKHIFINGNVLGKCVAVTLTAFLVLSTFTETALMESLLELIVSQPDPSIVLALKGDFLSILCLERKSFV